MIEDIISDMYSPKIGHYTSRLICCTAGMKGMEP